MDIIRRQGGQAFMLVLILLGIGAAVIVPFLQTASGALEQRDKYDEYIKEDYAADAAIEYGMWRLKYEENFAESLPVGTESEPFYITLNGYEASTTIVAQANSEELSGQELAGRADDDIFFKTEKNVVASATYLSIASDGFEPSGDSGPWIGDWYFTGTADETSSSPYEGSYCLRLLGHYSTSDGYAEREVDLSSSSGEGPFLHFWARVDSFESNDNDTADVLVSINGTSWDVIHTFTYHDSDYQYHLYQFDISSYGTPSSFYIAFDMKCDNNSDTLRVDDVRFTNSHEVTVVEPGVLTEFTYYVSIRCMDPDGCRYINYWNRGALDSMRDILPERGVSYGDWLHYIPGSTYWETPVYDTFAFDGFEDGINGGTGPWVEEWALSGDCVITTDNEYAGQYCLRLRGNNNGYAKREVDLSGATGEGLYLYFRSRVDDIEYGETITVRASTDGVNWDVLEVFNNYDDDHLYHMHEYNLSGYGKPASFFLSFEMYGDYNNDTFRVDNIEFTNFQGAGSGVWPMEPFDPTWSDEDSGGDRHQELVWDFETAGYDDVPFEYGEIKTMQFKAEAELTEGVYCNEFQTNTDSWGWGWGSQIEKGNEAKITVGNPVETNCSGGLLVVDKTVSPLIIYPNEPTTVNYTITIENVDTVDITIYEVEDWLPSTGDEDLQDSFNYVDDSAAGRIIGRDAFPIIFKDYFNRNDSNWVSFWTDSDDGGWDAIIDNERVYLRLGASITQSNISTANHTNIVFSYIWSGDSQADIYDKLKVEWKPSANVTWNTLAEHTLDQSYWHDEEWDLPTGAEETEIDIRFTGIADQSNEQARLDNVAITSSNTINYTPVCMPDDTWGYGDDFLEKYWHPDTRRWELEWDFSYYPGDYDPAWDPQNPCATYEYYDHNPYLTLHPGEIFEIKFQAAVTLIASGSYFDEVFVKIDEGGGWGQDDEWVYSWPTGGVTVPQYDLQGETLNSILRANAMLNPWGFWWISWHWWSHR